MSLLDSTCVYQLQPVDVRRGTVRKSQRHGHLVCDAEADWHSRLNLGTDSFTSFVTKGDGGCALHAVWGHPSSTGELALATGQNVGRQEIARLLPETLHAFQGACPGSDAVITSIWSELTLPSLEGTTDTEPCLFWSQLQKNSQSTLPSSQVSTNSDNTTNKVESEREAVTRLLAMLYSHQTTRNTSCDQF